MKTWLLLDCHNIAWAAFHTTGKLSYGNERTGSIFGFFQRVISLSAAYNTTNIVFCFDDGVPKRKDICPSYKIRRHSQPMSKKDLEARRDFKKQVEALKTQHLPYIGFANVFYSVGYEADDIIAAICKSSLPEKDKAVIVSTDKDMWQLLSPSVSIHTSKGRLTLESFKKAWGIGPKEWCTVKAMAGCDTDDVAGIVGIGEKTAAKFLKGELPATHKAHALIVNAEAAAITERNLGLVKLPLPGTPVFSLKPDDTDKKRWNEVVTNLGMLTLKNQLPVSYRELFHKGKKK